MTSSPQCGYPVGLHDDGRKLAQLRRGKHQYRSLFSDRSELSATLRRPMTAFSAEGGYGLSSCHDARVPSRGINTTQYIIRVCDVTTTYRTANPTLNSADAATLMSTSVGTGPIKLEETWHELIRDSLYIECIRCWRRGRSRVTSERATSPLCWISASIVLLAEGMANAVKTTSARLTLGPSKYGTQLFRSDGVALFTASVDRLAISLFGRWPSDAYEANTQLDDNCITTMVTRMTFGEA